MEEYKMNGVPITIDSIIADITIDAQNGIEWNPELYRKELEKLVALSAIGEGWIDVKDGLPEDEEATQMIVCYSNNVAGPSTMCAVYYNKRFYLCEMWSEWETFSDVINDVTHYMPLPNPPSLNTNKI